MAARPASPDAAGNAPELLDVLRRARELGFLGPGPVEAHVAHSSGLAAVLTEAAPAPDRLLDLGSGGGVPGLVLAAHWVSASVVLLDAHGRRTSFLEEAVERLGWSGRVTICAARAEVAGRDPARRGTFDAVVARGFGPPATTAECAAPFLRVGGLLLVAEPPGDADSRWHRETCAELGLVPLRRSASPVAAQLLRQEAICPERYPRRDGVPAKRPLF